MFCLHDWGKWKQNFWDEDYRRCSKCGKTQTEYGATVKIAALLMFFVLLLHILCTTAFAQDADGGSPDSVSPDGPDSTVTVSDYGG